MLIGCGPIAEQRIVLSQLYNANSEKEKGLNILDRVVVASGGKLTHKNTKGLGKLIINFIKYQQVEGGWEHVGRLFIIRRNWILLFMKFTIFPHSVCNLSFPLSNFDRSNNWLINLNSLFPLFRISWKCSFLFPLNLPDSICSIGPRIKVKGVRNSWDILAKNWDFIRSSSWSFSELRCSISNLWFIFILLNWNCQNP